MMEKGFEIQCLDHGFVRYIDHMGDDGRIVEAARISYKSPSKGPEADAKLLSYLYKNKHTSPFEMCKVTLNIKMPIFVMRQYIRHRMQNLNEVSARYTELPNEFYVPKIWRTQDSVNKQQSIVPNELAHVSDIVNWHKRCTEKVMKLCDEAYLVYQALLTDGVAREMARMVLPVNIYTEIYCCWDLKNLLHFISLREDGHAQSEIQEYASAMKTIAKELFPVTMLAFETYKWKLEE